MAPTAQSIPLRPHVSERHRRAAVTVLSHLSAHDIAARRKTLSALRLRKIAAHLAKFARTFDEPTFPLVPFFICSRWITDFIDFLACHLGCSAAPAGLRMSSERHHRDPGSGA
jgi:hypothetical protein